MFSEKSRPPTTLNTRVERLIRTLPETGTTEDLYCPDRLVAGAAGLLAANGATDIEATLKNSAEDIGLGDNEQGAGLLDVAAAFGLDSSDDL